MNNANKELSPYKGLGHYTTEDAKFFFGRDEWQETILDHFMASRITILYGESGVGKSSVLEAGVVNELIRMAAENKQESDMPKLAVVMFRSWSIAPQDGIVQCLQDAVQDAAISALQLSEVEAEAVKDLMPPFSTFTEALQAWIKCVGGRLYLILDQFEDYFLYQPKIDSQHQFILQLSQAINNPDLRANIIISIRDESHAKLDCLEVEIPNIFKQGLRIERLKWEEGKEAIEKPIQQYNREFAQQFDIDPKLPGEILKDIEVIRASQWLQGEAGLGDKDIVEKQEESSQMIETSCLQLVMDRLWEEEKKNQSPILQLETYEELGRAENIVKKHVNKQMENLSPQMQDTAACVFHYLVTRSRTKIAHTVGELVDLVNDEQGRRGTLTQEQVQLVLNKLYDPRVRILRPVPASRPQQEERYEIFHDVLAPAILDWRRRYLEKAETRKRRRKLLFGGVTFLIIGLLLVGANYKQELQKMSDEALMANSQLDKLIAAMKTKKSIIDSNILFKLRYKKFLNKLDEKLKVALRGSLTDIQEQNKFGQAFGAVWNENFNIEDPLSNLTYATISKDGTILLWNLSNKKNLAELKGNKSISQVTNFNCFHIGEFTNFMTFRFCF